MVTKKRTTTKASKKVSKKSTSKAVAIPQDWEAQLAQDAKAEYSEEAKSTGGSTSTLSTSEKRFSLGDEDLGTEIDVVVADNVFEHAYYDRPYDPDNPCSPACFAIGKDEKTMKPHPTSPDPQAKSCEECPLNEFGSALTGKGKACKNNRRLALYAYGQDGLSTEQMVILRLAPTGLKNFAVYAKGVAAKLKRPTYSVVTTMGFDTKKTYPIVTHKLHSELSAEDTQRVWQSKSEIEDVLMEPYDISTYVPLNNGKRRSKMS